MGLSAEITTIAERLRAAGYHTAGFSENPLVSETFGMAQGFEHYRSVTVAQLTAEALGKPHAHFEVVEALKAWAGAGAKTPLFVFVNLFDVHDPYQVRDENPFLPEGISVAEAKRVSATPVALCDRLPPRRELDILRGLYLGEVTEADRKLGQVVEAMRAAAAGEIVTIVTADHGEHLGEQRLLGHKFSLGNTLLHVPLVVHGAPEGEAGEIEQPVALRDVAASILAWAGEPPGAPNWRPLPLDPDDESPPRPLIAAWVDRDPTTTAALPPGAAVAAGALDARRASCGDADRVFGDMFSLTRFPFKLTWFEHHAAQLHDLGWDPREISDLARIRPELAAELGDELAAAREDIRGDAAEAPEPDGRKLEALQGLGYVE